jgi:hypothetical protein
MTGLTDKILKKKHLIKSSNSMILIVPDTWIRALDWTQSTNLIMSIHADDKKIVISEDPIQKEIPLDEVEIVDDEKIGNIESG